MHTEHTDEDYMSETAVEKAKDNLPATAADMGLETGLEDFDTTDMVMPRIGIDHKETLFVDNLTGEKFEELSVVLLGLIKQRILWAPEVDTGDHPLCKSYNFREGVPDPKKFPLNDSGFDELPSEGGTLPCDSCSLKEWGSHPQRDTPWCSEQHTFPLLMQAGDDPSNFASPAMFTVQRSAIKASKSYLTGFARNNTPLFTVVTKLALDARKRGSVDYAVPRFAKVGNTDQDDWPEYAEHYRTIRGFLTTPPPEGEDDVPDDATPRTSSAGTSEVSNDVPDDDDLPF